MFSCALYYLFVFSHLNLSDSNFKTCRPLRNRKELRNLWCLIRDISSLLLSLAIKSCLVKALFALFDEYMQASRQGSVGNVGGGSLITYTFLSQELKNLPLTCLSFGNPESAFSLGGRVFE
uniref:Uncharacterized protein n=1 Tax=Lactuca sativa TaxID=4236 RepID=A0A9R1VUK8_LACSA|nr:hypothetical protein LSAT_V11C400180440 [Lactuca sativa]